MGEIFIRHDLAVDERALFRLGQLELLVARSDHGWSVGWRHAPDDASPWMSVERPSAVEQLGEGASVRSFTFSHSLGPLELRPMLADRAYVVRPVHELVVAPKDLVQLYVTTALWVSLRVGEGELPLLELPCVQLKETWFGANTIDGERCYAGRLPLCHVATGCAGMPHRAVTPLTIRNRAAEPLPIERLRLPVPRLPLHRARDGAFWTSRVSVVRKDGADEVDVEVFPSAPDEAGQAKLIAPARDAGAGNVVSRALGTMFSHSLIP
jgi:hypothetical protein